MQYATVREMLCAANFQDNILIESLFKETTRSGRLVLRLVELALTPNLMIVAPMNAISAYRSNRSHHLNDNILLNLISFYPLENLQFTIFKKTKRKSLKICFHNETTKYFELEANTKRKVPKIFWNMWCVYALELSCEKKIWPFKNAANEFMQPENTKMTKLLEQNNARHSQWIDKYIYLGSIREHEDINRPIPVPGLGPTEDIKLLYLKPQYFGCWDQSEHWVQCE